MNAIDFEIEALEARLEMQAVAAAEADDCACAGECVAAKMFA
jgi:hypothetical protein